MSFKTPVVFSNENIGYFSSAGLSTDQIAQTYRYLGVMTQLGDSSGSNTVYGTEETVYNTGYTPTQTVRHSDTRYVSFYGNSNSNSDEVTGVVCDVSGSTINQGQKNLSNLAGGTFHGLSACYISETEGVLLFKNSNTGIVYGSVYTILGDQITYGPVQSFIFDYKNDMAHGNQLVTISDDKMVFTYCDRVSGYLSAAVINKSGNILTAGTITVIISFYGIFTSITKVGTDKIVIMSADQQNTGLVLVPCDISGTTIIPGNISTVSINTIGYFDCVYLSASTFGFAYIDNSYPDRYLYSNTGTISGQDITLDLPELIETHSLGNTNTNTTCTILDNDKFLVTSTYWDGSQYVNFSVEVTSGIVLNIDFVTDYAYDIDLVLDSIYSTDMVLDYAYDTEIVLDSSYSISSVLDYEYDMDMVLDSSYSISSVLDYEYDTETVLDSSYSTNMVLDYEYVWDDYIDVGVYRGKQINSYSTIITNVSGSTKIITSISDSSTIITETTNNSSIL